MVQLGGTIEGLELLQVRGGRRLSGLQFETGTERAKQEWMGIALPRKIKGGPVVYAFHWAGLTIGLGVQVKACKSFSMVCSEGRLVNMGQLLTCQAKIASGCIAFR